ncbi:uncharacterized protein EV154DRAFT_413931 [Mucor mucedo]|uniref:uncharacterized protein n=1 Tax=Mucor mucedo TaxID=29922 RepID=UPI002220EE13|nr:uncharacterized protein EV154DRAFT_413931 [Mucor mucedo]KAI7895064.1 hypothetical protein EV154DRAFT_413931 [Mucor mucedo]
MAANSVYLYRHVQTKQILLGTMNAPVRLRKDLWRPLVALTGFQTPQSAQAVTDALLQRSKARQVELQTSPDHVARPKRLRVVDELDLVETSIVSLREALESVAPKENLLALWEQPQFMEMKGDKAWPSFLEHGQLELKNNRFVKETK